MVESMGPLQSPHVRGEEEHIAGTEPLLWT
jgi:hypothetical protein